MYEGTRRPRVSDLKRNFFKNFNTPRHLNGEVFFPFHRVGGEFGIRRLAILGKNGFSYLSTGKSKFYKSLSG